MRVPAGAAVDFLPDPARVVDDADRYDPCDPVYYLGIACCVELHEVGPTPGRTIVALGLRAVSDGPDVAHVGDGFDA